MSSSTIVVVPVPGDDVDPWHRNDWAPAKQAALVSILADGDLVRQVAWDAGVRDAFERAWEQERKRAQGGEQAEGRYRRGLAMMANPMAATRGALFKEAEEKRDREFSPVIPTWSSNRLPRTHPSHDSTGLDRRRHRSRSRISHRRRRAPAMRGSCPVCSAGSSSCPRMTPEVTRTPSPMRWRSHATIV